MARIRRADEAALAELYDETSGQVFGLIVRIIGDRAAAEEVALDIYTQVWTQAGKFDASRGSLWSWLMLLARSRSIDFLRSRTRRAQDREQELNPVVHDLSDAAPDPEAQLLGSVRRRTVLAAMAQLEPAKRSAIELAYFGGLSHTEIAERLGDPLGTVKSRIRSGLMQLREALGPHGGTL